MNKSEEYLKISEEIVNGVGGMDNIQGSAHCATRLRIVLKDNDKADMEKLENINKVKGAFVAGNQLQLIFGASNHFDSVLFIFDGGRRYKVSSSSLGIHSPQDFSGL